ncbi:outer membrane protein [Bradyrhizobium sp. CCBAU 51765]|uniref:outer membrane protein n=1 Tax=Bradyrhizobium sp. CCBAU 51765 TaxID=1325102 RepID=UPI00188802CF|nr:outer membrane beta-barrel protein [Bradyrhizobium sp. CCBAU 51765]QOZ13265.1 porin family protein [Bradyrhizobium sp. CCBAU 51765]
MLKKLIVAFALMSLPGLAVAADLPVRSQMPLKAPPLQQQAFSWTGFYIGGNIGGAFDNSDRVDVTGLAGPGSLDLRSKSDGVTAGGQFGYNYEFSLGNLSGIVIGVEADAAYTDLSGSLPIAAGPGATVNLNSRLDYLGTIRGRLGYAFDRLLVYGTGGFAYGTVEHSADLNGANFANLKTTETGFTYGGGFEYALPVDVWLHMSSTSAVTVGAEYLRYELDDNSLNFAVGATAASIKLKDVGNLARARINYKF